MEKTAALERYPRRPKQRYSADFIRRQPEYQFLIASIQNGTFKPRNYGDGAECCVQEDRHLEVLRRDPPRPATAAVCRVVGQQRGHKVSIVLEKPPLERSVSSVGFSELSKTLASMSMKDEPSSSTPLLSTNKPWNETSVAVANGTQQTTITSGHVGLYGPATNSERSSCERDSKANPGKDGESRESAEAPSSRSSGYVSATTSLVGTQHTDTQVEFDRTSGNIGSARHEERKPKKSVHIQNEIDLCGEDYGCVATADHPIEIVASENARPYMAEHSSFSTIQEEKYGDREDGGANSGTSDGSGDQPKPGPPGEQATRTRRVGVTQIPDQLVADLQRMRKPSLDVPTKPSDAVPSRRVSANSSVHNQEACNRKPSSAPSQQSGSGRKTSSAAGWGGCGASKRRVSVISHSGGTPWYDPMVERSTKFLRGREPKFSQCDQCLKPAARPGLTRLQISYTQTNTAHNDRVIFTDLLLAAHRRSIVMNEGVRCLERRLKSRRDDVTRATTFYDRYTPASSATPCLPQPPPRRRRKTPGTVAQKKRERRERIEKKNQDIKLGYTPTADTLPAPSSADIARLTDCRYLRVHPERMRLIRAESYFR